MNRLSICIPTYNRGQFIGETIKSIITQATDEVEIVISDNGSDDDTEELVREYQKIFSRIRYFRWSRNVGADRNFLKVIEIASGDYCWFMGSDDLVEPGAIQHILFQLDSQRDITGASVNQKIYTLDMQSELKGVPIAGGRLDSDRLFDNAEVCFCLLGLYFGYISGQIVNRELWNRTVDEAYLDPYFNAFVHIYVIGQMLLKNPNWLYINQRCVAYRSGNDSFLNESGLYNRQVIAHASFEKIVRDLFGKGSATYDAALKLNLTGYMRGDLAHFKKNGVAISLQVRLIFLYVRFYWHYFYFWLNVFPLFFVPRTLVGLLHRLHKHWRQKIA